MMLRKEYADVAEHVGKQMNEGFYGDLSRSTYILRDLAIKCQSIADEEIGENLKLIQSNPYALSQFSNIWAEGFEAGQKSTLLPAPLSITGRWWLTEMGSIIFLKPIQYEEFQYAADNNPCGCRWLTEETTIEFAADEQKSTFTSASVTGRWWQSKNKEVFFIYKNQYVIYERITENNSDNSRWLSDEETREF